jgi:hypothetical protein
MQPNIEVEIIPHDDKSINDEDGVIRRISPQQIVFDPKVGGNRISSSAFNPSSGPNGGLSVDIQKKIEQAGVDAREFVTKPPWIGSIRFTAGQLRVLGLKIGYDPLPENPHHGEVWGSFTQSIKKKLPKLSEWFVRIDDVSL